MRIAVLGRTRMLRDAAALLHSQGHEIVFVATAKAAAEETVGPEDFRKLALQVGCQYVEGLLLSEPHILAQLSAARAELGISMNWPGMFGADVLSRLGRGLINAHGSDLPKYRGNACPNWAILMGEHEVGLTLHMIEAEGLDTGPVVLKKFHPLTCDTYIGDVYDWLYKAVPGAFSEAVALMANPGFTPAPQPTQGAIRAYPRRPEDSRIRWRENAEQIHRLIRASSRPFAGAFCYYEASERVSVYRATPVSLPFRIVAVPGQVLQFDAQGVVVACGEATALRLDAYETASGIALPRRLRGRFTD